MPVQDPSKPARQIEDQIDEMRGDIARLTALLGDFAEGAQDKAREATESVESYIKQKPLHAVLIALGVGVLFGLFSRR